MEEKSYVEDIDRSIYDVRDDEKDAYKHPSHHPGHHICFCRYLLHSFSLPFLTLLTRILQNHSRLLHQSGKHLQS